MKGKKNNDVAFQDVHSLIKQEAFWLIVILGERDTDSFFMAPFDLHIWLSRILCGMWKPRVYISGWKLSMNKSKVSKCLFIHLWMSHWRSSAASLTATATYRISYLSAGKQQKQLFLVPQIWHFFIAFIFHCLLLSRHSSNLFQLASSLGQADICLEKQPLYQITHRYFMKWLKVMPSKQPEMQSQCAGQLAVDRRCFLAVISRAVVDAIGCFGMIDILTAARAG